MTQKWAHPRESETICMEPLDLRKGVGISNLIDYASDVTRQVGAIFTDPATARHREFVDTIVIPVRDMGGWTWYCTSIFSHSQCVVRFPRRERVPAI